MKYRSVYAVYKDDEKLIEANAKEVANFLGILEQKVYSIVNLGYTYKGHRIICVRDRADNFDNNFASEWIETCALVRKGLGLKCH